jgi:N-acetylneuraminic acid mutarotase
MPTPSCRDRPGAWLVSAAMPAVSRSHAAAVHEGVIHVFGGHPPTQAVRAYDPATSAWTPRADMPIDLYGLSSHAVDGKLFVIGGWRSAGFEPAVQVYDPIADTWEQKTPRPTHRYIFSSEAVNGKIYVIGGHGTLDDGPQQVSGDEWEFKDLVEIYDPVGDRWSTGSAAPQPFAGGASCALDGKIYVFGGEANNLTQIYDTASDSWSSGTPPPVARNGHTCVRRGGSLWLFGGRSPSGWSLDTVEAYDPTTDSWSQQEPMPSARYWFPAVTVDEQIYVIGGEFQDLAAPGNPVTLLEDVQVLCSSGGQDG